MAQRAKVKVKVKKVKTTQSVALVRKLYVSRPDILHGYLRHREINQYLLYLEQRFNFVKVHTLGTTYEKRKLKGIEIDWWNPRNMAALTKESRRVYGRVKNIQRPGINRNTIFIEGGTHAREWISISVALHCIYQLTERNLRNRGMLKKLRFFIVPLVNPDGYEFTRSKNSRWRKNRRPIKNSKHIGTDCNRNYDFFWNNDDGASRPSRNTFKGEKPFSEPETVAIRDVLEKLAPNLLFFLSLHSYAQCIMYPWGYCKELPTGWQELAKLAQIGKNAIKTHYGRHYRIGSISALNKHLISGSVVDYAFGVINVPLTLVMELPALEYGFFPPPDNISTLGEESWFGIREMCHHAFELSPTFDARDAMAKALLPRPTSGGTVNPPVKLQNPLR